MNKQKIKHIYNKVSNTINELEKMVDKKPGYVNDISNGLLESLREMRKNALNISGKYHEGNLIYKLLRRTKYIDKLKSLVNNSYDKLFSTK